MTSAVSPISADGPVRIARSRGTRTRRDRLLLAIGTLAALVAAAIGGAGAGTARVDVDLARLLRYMALLKGAFAVIAFAGCYWRLARPAPGWREAVYIGGPALMAGGALGLWQLQWTGFATIGLHAGLFALLATALTDPDFIPGLRRWPVRKARLGPPADFGRAATERRR